MVRSSQETASAPTKVSAFSRRMLFAVLFVLSATNLTACLIAYISRTWIYDRDGFGIPADFVSFWAAGRLALEGLPAQAFDWEILRQIEVAALGQDFVGSLPWHYPPPFLFVASLMALLPYGAAYFGWSVVSLMPYVAVVRAIVGHNLGVLLALAVPIVFFNALVGQTGFLTAALIGGTLYLIPVRPGLAGICLGLLTYKPQFGLLFPVVLMAAGHWRVFVSATVTTIAMVLISALAFGTASWVAFFYWLSHSSNVILIDGRFSWWKLMSLYSLVRHFGGTEQLAWMLQLILVLSTTLVLVLMWRSRVPYGLKAAALAAGTLLVTPYIAIYDMLILTISVAFLFRMGLRSGFRSYELAALASTLALVLSFLTSTPTGLGATLIVWMLILARAGSSWWREPAPKSVAAGV
ncbi:glycosyltransferase family 87 protein [Bradyrhizobium stylosanthis]|uniref:glycosyltransferase family 87 protein n=1 Tax=Bradyrhizobium stylosanthis TaxID=1803665 RepID=UPI0007C4C364|nr:glycosyltransferase family 87 protein [Bradyrhizobium stylosanthis]